MKFFAARAGKATAKDAKKGARGKGKAPAGPSLDPDRIIDLFGLGLIGLGLVLLLSFLSANQSMVTNALLTPLTLWLGWGTIVAPLALIVVGGYLLWRRFGDQVPGIPWVRLLAAVTSFLTLLGLFHAFQGMGTAAPLIAQPANSAGGGLGRDVFRGIGQFIGPAGAVVVLLITLLIAGSTVFGRSLRQVVLGVGALWHELVLQLRGARAVSQGPRINEPMRKPRNTDTITPAWDPEKKPASGRVIGSNDDDGLRINGLRPAPKAGKAAKRDWADAPVADAPEQLPLPRAKPAKPAPEPKPVAADPPVRINTPPARAAVAEVPPSAERKAQPARVIGGSGVVAAAAQSSLDMQQAPAREWTLPVVPEVLEPGREATKSVDDIRARALVIEETLIAFGVPAKVTEVNPGPTITQFCVEPGFLEMKGGKQQKVKVSRIAALADDLALALAAPRIRIEAPVPGKSYVGIEVPNGETALVSLRDVMESEEYDRLQRKTRLRLGLGSDVSGHPVVADLTAMPHMLIAGTTGSGKSVCVNAIITALLINNSPDDLRLLMVDPKRVELTGYNGIPHLIAPVVVDVEQVGGVLKWTTNEMDRRYRLFAKHGARNITDWNTKAAEKRAEGQPADPDLKHLPYIVLFIDELADLMMLAPDETEKTICRLAQMARATGIHLILATQRPSVDVVTGLIKANFPARIAFTVASAIDSRVILDGPGAEKLLGRGDMLVLTPDQPAPQRAQGCFLSDKEIQKVVRHWRAQSAGAPAAQPLAATQMKLPIAERVMDGAGLPSASNLPTTSPVPAAASPAAPPWEAAPDFAAMTKSEAAEASASGGGDTLFDEAVATVRLQGKASISLLQRRLRIGYTRAARMIEEMEEKGIVGPSVQGSQFRDVLPPKA